MLGEHRWAELFQCPEGELFKETISEARAVARQTFFKFIEVFYSRHATLGLCRLRAA